jgi:hypothetical protein
MERFVRAEDHAGLAGAGAWAPPAAGSGNDRARPAAGRRASPARDLTVRGRPLAPTPARADERDTLNRRLRDCQDDLERARRATGAVEEQVQAHALR